MPEQASRRGQVGITTANLGAPFETKLVRLGVGGLNLKDELDRIPAEQASRLSDIDHDAQGSITSRPGQTSFATAGTQHHSVRALLQPATDLLTRVWGIDTALYYGASGALTQIDSGYSGDPLSLVPHRPPLSGDPWMFVGDRSRMRKVRATDGLDLPIGLPAPGAAPTAALAGPWQTSIAAFDTSDGSQASAWTGTAGRDAHAHLANPPTTADLPGQSGLCVEFQTQIGTALDGGYDSWWGLAGIRNLNLLNSGTVTATDDDLLHLWVQVDQPNLLEEIRLYLVVSATYSATILPGTDPDGLLNTDAYYKTIRRNDYAQFIATRQTETEATSGAAGQVYENSALFVQGLPSYDAVIDSVNVARQILAAQQDQTRQAGVQAGGGAREWVEYGSFAVPLRRSDFVRIGSDTTRDWGDVQGVLIYVKVTEAQPIKIRLDAWYLHGGSGVDSVEPGAQPYDWRYTHYDTRTGAEGNPSPVIADSARLDVERRPVTITPVAYGDASVRQRIYRRGGGLIDDWYYVGQTASDGGAFQDVEADDAIVAAGTVAIDHFEPVPTVNASGTTVLAQPLPALWGPISGMLLGCGDPYRPGHLYWSNPGAPDHWSSANTREVCPPSEELMGGGMAGAQAFVFSRLRLYLLYPSFTGDAAIDYTPTACKRGIPTRTAFCVGPGGIYFVAREEGIYLTQGGPETWISRDIDPLFQGKTRHGYRPIDWTALAALRLTTWENKVYFLYQDIDGERHTLVFHILEQFWRHYQFGRAISLVQGEDEPLLLLGGLNQGKTYQHTGTSDDGLAIAPVIRTGALDGDRREEKLFGDQILDADAQGVTITVQNFLDEETVTNLSTTATAAAGRTRFVLDVFGETPQRGRSISTALSWSTALTPPVLYRLGYGLVIQPEITAKRVTQWDDLGQPDEFWTTGVTLDVDTGNEAVSVRVERDYNGIRDPIATITVQASGRHKLAFSWPGVPARQIRLRPIEDCEFWILYRVDWIVQPEPPRIAGWDVFFENAWDQYYTGLDLYCDTNGQEKRIEVSVDGTLLINSLAGGLAYWPVQTTGRRVVHLTLPWGRGHVFRFVAIDANPGVLYDHRWHLDPEPSEQANWNQNFSTLGTRADKYLKAVIFECDTYGEGKQVQIQADGVSVETITVRSNGRGVVQTALTTQALGRVWRMFPVDGNPGRLYSVQPIFDEEPYKLSRWETQETNHGLRGWFVPLSGQIVLKSTADVTLTLTVQVSQPTATKPATTRIQTYTIPSTDGAKVRHFQTFQAIKGALVKYVLTSTDPFWLYREETALAILPWGAGEAIAVQPFGSDDLDPTRPMTQAVLAAEAPGGTLGDRR